MVIVMLSFVTAESSYTFKQGKVIDLRVPVFDDTNSPATSAIDCTLNVISPTQVSIVNNGAMGFNTGGIYNYSIPAMTELGEYASSMSCTNGTISGFSTFGFDVTENGFALNQQKSVMQTLVIPLIGSILALLLISMSFVITNDMAIKSFRYTGILIGALNLYMCYLLGANDLLFILSGGVIVFGVGSLLEEN